MNRSVPPGSIQERLDREQRVVAVRDGQGEDLAVFVVSATSSFERVEADDNAASPSSTRISSAASVNSGASLTGVTVTLTVPVRTGGRRSLGK